MSHLTPKYKKSLTKSRGHKKHKSDVSVLDRDTKDTNHVVVENLDYFCISRKHTIFKFWDNSVNETQILEKAHCAFPRNKLSGIVGPSGAGKTTLLGLISGRVSNTSATKITGKIKINKEHLSNKNRRGMRQLCGFVTQDDLMMASLTVRENIKFSCDLRLSATVSEAEKIGKVDGLIQALGLTHCADRQVGGAKIRGVSGGERKRTAIAMEMVTDPKILFLDEPTTGLDASTALSVLKVCKSLSEHMTIILTIHQPRACIWDLFDHVVIMNCQEKTVDSEHFDGGDENSSSIIAKSQKGSKKLRTFSSSSFTKRLDSNSSWTGGAGQDELHVIEKSPGTVVAEGEPDNIDWLLKSHKHPCSIYDNIPDHFMDVMKLHKEFHNQILRIHLKKHEKTNLRFHRGAFSRIDRLRSERVKEGDIDKTAVQMPPGGKPINEQDDDARFKSLDDAFDAAKTDEINLPARGRTLNVGTGSAGPKSGHVKSTTLGLGLMNLSILT